MHGFKDQVVVVSGAGTGLGRAMAEGFAREGAKLVLADIDAAALETTLGLAHEHGAEAIAVPTDVMRQEALDNLAARTLEYFDRVDIVCSNAGVCEHIAPAWEKSLTDWAWVMGVNLYGLVHAVNAFIPIMRKQGSGHLVCTGSNTSLHANSGCAVYVASKCAAIGLCEALQHDLRQAGSPVRVSIVCPGSMATEIPDSARNRPAALGGKQPSAEELAMARTYLARGLTPKQAAAIVLEGIAERRFYILTHDEDKSAVQEWAAGVVAGQLSELKIPPVGEI